MWIARLPFPNHTLHSLHSRPRGFFFYLASLLKCRCWCVISLGRSQECGHRLQIFRAFWLVKKCWRRVVLVKKNLKQPSHFHGSDLTRAIFINSLAFVFVFALDFDLEKKFSSLRCWLYFQVGKKGKEGAAEVIFDRVTKIYPVSTRQIFSHGYYYWG